MQRTKGKTHGLFLRPREKTLQKIETKDVGMSPISQQLIRRRYGFAGKILNMAEKNMAIAAGKK